MVSSFNTTTTRRRVSRLAGPRPTEVTSGLGAVVLPGGRTLFRVWAPPFEIVSPHFAWTDDEWRAPDLRDFVICELAGGPGSPFARTFTVRQQADSILEPWSALLLLQTTAA